MNETIRKFGFPDTLIAEFEHWVVLLRPAQPTLGSLVLAARSDATAFGDLPAEAHAELSVVTKAIEDGLRRAVLFQKLNYLMLMMVDPNVHFHVLPRYEGSREQSGIIISDAGWPGQPDLGSGAKLDAGQIAALTAWLRPYFA